MQRWAPASCNRCFPSESWKRRRWHAIITGNTARSQQRCITAAHKTEQHVFTGELTHLSWPVSSNLQTAWERLKELPGSRTVRSGISSEDWVLLWSHLAGEQGWGQRLPIKCSAPCRDKKTHPLSLGRGRGRATTLLYMLVSVHPDLYQNVNPPEREKLKTCFLHALWHKRKKKKAPVIFNF